MLCNSPAISSIKQPTHVKRPTRGRSWYEIIPPPTELVDRLELCLIRGYAFSEVSDEGFELYPMSRRYLNVSGFDLDKISKKETGGFSFF